MNFPNLSFFSDHTLPPNEVFTTTTERSRESIQIRLYGTFHGEPFTRVHITRSNVERILSIHGATHSAALFLSQKDRCQVAMYNEVGFSMPQQLEYVKYYTNGFPLLVTAWGRSVEFELERNFPPFRSRRWCTRLYKIRIPRRLLRVFNLRGVTILKGMTKFQSKDRAALDPARCLDPAMGGVRFPVYQELPIHDWPVEQQLALLEKHGIARNPNEVQFGIHGCLLCPYRSESYYAMLRDEHPDLYVLCHHWREVGSRNWTGNGGDQYYYFRKSKIM